MKSNHENNIIFTKRFEDAFVENGKLCGYDSGYDSFVKFVIYSLLPE